MHQYAKQNAVHTSLGVRVFKGYSTLAQKAKKKCPCEKLPVQKKKKN